MSYSKQQEIILQVFNNLTETQCISCKNIETWSLVIKTLSLAGHIIPVPGYRNGSKEAMHLTCERWQSAYRNNERRCIYRRKIKEKIASVHSTREYAERMNDNMIDMEQVLQLFTYKAIPEEDLFDTVL